MRGDRPLKISHVPTLQHKALFKALATSLTSFLASISEQHQCRGAQAPSWLRAAQKTPLTTVLLPLGAGYYAGSVL